MSKFAPDITLDAMLDFIADNGDRLVVCAGQPTSFASYGATSTILATVALTTGDGNGDYTIGDGTPDGRALTIAEQANLSVTASNDADHIAIDNGTDTLYYVTTCTSQTLTSGNEVTVPTWSITIADPT